MRRRSWVITKSAMNFTGLGEIWAEEQDHISNHGRETGSQSQMSSKRAQAGWMRFALQVSRDSQRRIDAANMFTRALREGGPRRQRRTGAPAPPLTAP